MYEMHNGLSGGVVCPVIEPVRPAAGMHVRHLGVDGAERLELHPVGRDWFIPARRPTEPVWTASHSQDAPIDQ